MADSQDSGEGRDIKIPELFYFTKTVHHEPYDRISPLRPELSAEGKNIVVTGGGTGIGKAIALEFARAGVKSISILGRREDRLISASSEIADATTGKPVTVTYELADLMKQKEAKRAFGAIVDKVGKIDVLVSNAGVLQDIGPILGYDANEFMRGFEINVLSAFNAVQEFLPLAGEKPMIINISSCIAHMAPMPYVSGYATSKAANLKMMDYVAAENPHVHVVNVQPGTVTTEMSAKAGVPGKDLPALPGQFCVWLASPEAEFLKSKFVWANWDIDELLKRADEIQNSRLFTWLLDGNPL